MTERERMDRGLLYDPGADEIMDEQLSFLDVLYDFNNTRPSEMEKRMKILYTMFAEIGEDCYIQPPFNANWGGKHIHMGKGVYANSNFTVVDDGDVFIGDFVMFGPNVTIATAGHPIRPDLREKALQYNIPVHIGNNVWVGAGAIILPGITIGDNSVIGAGSVVTKDIPENVVAVGNPCKILRQINEHDMKYYFKDREIDL